MDVCDVDSLPVGVIRLDREDRVVAANAWFRRWAGEDVIGRPLRDTLVPVKDFLDGAGRYSVMMAAVRDPERAVLAVRAADGDGAVLTVMDASDRYVSGQRLRDSFALADRTRHRLQLIIDASIAFADATSEERLSEILAAAAAKAYGADESAVFLFDEHAHAHRVAGENPLDLEMSAAAITAAARQLHSVVTITSRAEADGFAPELGEAMQGAGVRALIAAPLEVEGMTLGVFACFFRHPRVFDAEAGPLAEALAGQAAQTLATVRLQRQLEHAATHDETTDLPNRRRLDEIARQVDHARAAVIFIDLDGFKDVNDQLGHDVGDEVLREVAARLRQHIRDVDVIARYGGDEFVVVCDADAEVATEIAARLREALSEEYPFLPAGLCVGASIGVAIADVNNGVLGIDRLIRDADQAMYLAKGRGGNQIAVAGLAVGAG
jgi:diguanylate cyclase (GGDEF)-like protein